MTRVEYVLKRLGIDATKKGREWVALCPNPEHDDHSPSWRIRDDPGGAREGFHRCWPCGFEGGLVQLVAVRLKCSFRKANEWLESDAIEAPIPVAVNLVIRESRKFELPYGTEITPLEKWPTPARRYAKKRHLSAAQVDRWGLGYAVDGRLEGRIVIPYRNRKGQPRGYTGRSFVGHTKRYLEPQASERADRGVLFGEQHWKKGGVVIVLEGAINGLAVERAYPEANIAAMSGSNLPPSAALKLTGFDMVIIATDPDPAGDKIAEHLGWILDRQEVMNHRLVFPLETDADSLERDELKELIESSVWAMR